MPRPRKFRKVCCMPKFNEFGPKGNETEKSEPIILSIDEYETIRLIDNEGFSQEQCGEYMKVARTTIQMIYNNARKKIASSIVNGYPLRIEGGDYHLCNGDEVYCGCGGCRKHRCLRVINNKPEDDEK